MIERYTRPEMGRVWSEAHKYELWARVELGVLAAHARGGTVPADSVEPVRSAKIPTPQAVAAVEAVTDHDVIAFLTAWADNTEPRAAAAWVHYGMTSSDLIDTALAMQLTEASDLLIAQATRLVAVLRDHALAHRDTLRPGRTHGVHAEPDSWGHRVADFAFAMARSRDRLVRAREAVAVGTLSGPVGSYSNIDPAIEAEVLPALGLRPADVATQVVMRDGMAEEPFCPRPNGSASSATSVRCPCRTSSATASHTVAASASAPVHSAMPSRMTTWVATSAGRSPSAAKTSASMPGSMLE